MIERKYFDNNGVTYYRTSLLYYHIITKRTYGNEGYYTNHLNDYICLESYGTSQTEDPFLCFTLSNFTNKNMIDICYVIYNNENLLNVIKNSNVLHIHGKIDNYSKIIYINLKSYIEKLLVNFNYNISTTMMSYKAKYEVCININLNDYKLCLYKPILFTKKYVSNFKSIPDLIKKDLEEISKLTIDLDTIDKYELNHILKNVLNVDDYCTTDIKLLLPINKFNNLKIIYNNYDRRRNPSLEEIELFDNLKEYNIILKSRYEEDPVYIQLKGIKFCIDDKIIIDDGFKKHTLNTLPENVKNYILSVCKIEYLKSEIEKIILS